MNSVVWSRLRTVARGAIASRIAVQIASYDTDRNAVAARNRSLLNPQQIPLNPQQIPQQFDYLLFQALFTAHHTLYTVH